MVFAVWTKFSMIQRRQTFNVFFLRLLDGEVWRRRFRCRLLVPTTNRKDWKAGARGCNCSGRRIQRIRLCKLLKRIWSNGWLGIHSSEMTSLLRGPI
nr:unnamed protein product [Spirometra erinaceieuropaei]